MDVCLPEEFLRLNGADDGDRDDSRSDDWFGGEAWVSGVPRHVARGARGLRGVRGVESDDPTWMVT